MKTTTITALLGSGALVQAQWWAGAPDCAQTCFSSWWSSATASSWPAPTSYCSATQGASVSSCLQSACSATPTAAVSYSSLSSSLCSQWSSCSASGSTGVYTISAPAYTGNWGPGGPGGTWGGGRGGGGPGGHRGPGDQDWNGDGQNDRDEWDQWTRTWSGGVYTVTGCEWNGNVWAGGPGGYGRGGAGGSPWGPWGKGWEWTTVTETVTRVVTVTSSGGVTALSTSVGLATVAKAVSGDVTSTSIIGDATQTAGNSGGGGGNGGGSGGGAGATGSGSSVPGAAGRNEALGVKVMGAVLGGVVAVAALL